MYGYSNICGGGNISPNLQNILYRNPRKMLQYRRLNPQGERPLVTSMQLHLKSMTKADLGDWNQQQSLLSPIWLSATTLAYVSGCSVIKYNLRGPELTPVKSVGEVSAIRALVGVEKEGRSGYMYLMERESGWVVVMHIDSQGAVGVGYSITQGQSGAEIVLVTLMHGSKHLAVCTIRNSNYHVDIYNLLNGSQLIHYQTPHKIINIFPKDQQRFIMLDEKGLSVNAYGIQTFDIGQTIPVGQVLKAKLVGDNGIVVIVQTNQILLIQTELEMLDRNSKKFVLSEKVEIVAVDIIDSYVIVAMQESFLIVHFSISEREVYWERKWIEIKQMRGVQRIIVSPHCQNILLLCQHVSKNPIKPEPNLKCMQLITIDMLSSGSPMMLTPQRLPIDCTVTNSLCLCTSNLKEQLWRLTSSSVCCVPFGSLSTPPIPLEQPTCLDIDPHGLFLIIGFEFYFNIFAIRRQGLVMVHSQPALNSRQACYLSLLPIYVVMFKHQFRLYDKNTNKQIHEEQTSHCSLQFVTFRVNHRNSEAIFVESTGRMLIYDLITRKMIREVQTKIESVKNMQFQYDWVSNLALWTSGGATLFVEKHQPYFVNAPITSLKLCQQLGVLFYGDKSGVLNVVSWPEFQTLETLPLFSEPVKLLALSSDRCWLFVCSSFGNIATISLSYQVENQILSRDSIINTLRSLGIGLSTFYLKNLTFEMNQKKLESQIRELQIENQRKHILYEQEFEEIASKLTQQSSENKNRYKKHRQGVLIRHRNTLRVSKRQFKTLEVELAQLKNQGSIKDVTRTYKGLLQRTDQLKKQQQQFIKQFEKQIADAKVDYQAKLKQIQQSNKKTLQQKQQSLKIQQQHQKQDCQDYSALLTNVHLPPLQTTLKTLTSTIQQLYTENQQLNVRRRYLNEQRQRYEARRLEYRDILPQLEQDVLRVTSEDKSKKITAEKLAEQLTVLEEKLNSQEFSGQSEEIGHLKMEGRIEEALEKGKEENCEIQKLRKILEGLDQQFVNVEGVLVKEAHRGSVITSKLQILAETKKSLQQKLKQTRIKQHLTNYSAKKCFTSATSSPTRHTPPLTGVIDELCKQQNLRQLRINNMTKCFKSRIKIHIKQNQQLLQDTNNLTMEKRTNQKISNNKREQIARQLRGSMFSKRKEGDGKGQWLTPFQKYHKRQTTRQSRSTNCSFLGSRS